METPPQLAMAGKAPYYYSELLPSMSGDEVDQRPVCGTLEKNAGFENPLLSIEPDITTPDSTLDKAKHYQKKKKKKKKHDDQPIYRRSHSLFHNGCSEGKYGTTSGENQLSKKQQKHKRRNSEPNIYEEIHEAGKVYEESVYTMGRPPRSVGRPEVEQVHSLILENLNLDVEAMLMPKDGSCSEQLSQVLESPYGKSTYGTARSAAAAAPRTMNEYILQQSDFTPGAEVSGGTAKHKGKAGGPEDNIYEEVDLEGLGWGLDLPASDSEDAKSRSSRRKSGKSSDSLTSGFTRWFSTRKKEYELDRCVTRLNKRYTMVVGEEGYVDVKIPKKQRSPLSLPPVPPGLSPEKLHRRFIISNLVDSENSYVITLQRLIRDYKHPLEDSTPPILCPKKIATMFYRVEQILQCHNIFGIRLGQCIRKWDEDERIGDVFAGSFSMRMVLDIYSDFINNFSLAMETARQAAKQKSAFAEFLKVKQHTSSDQLSFFGLMVKPVQRFPQFILLLQDLLKNTPLGHPDRINLQLALSQLEYLTETLNERKREAEQHFAARDLMRRLGGKFSLRPTALAPDRNHFLIRQDEVKELHLDSTGLLVKSKPRRIFLLNDLLVSISVTSKSSRSSRSSEHYSLKWSVPLSEVEVQESATPATSTLLASSSLHLDRSGVSTGGGEVQELYGELKDLFHDLGVVSRIVPLVNTLRNPRPELSSELIQKIIEEIQEQIKEKNEEITLIDSCCLHLSLPTKNRSKESVYLQFRSPRVKRDWSTDVRLARLALDANNNPAWETTDPERRLLGKQPLFVKSLTVFPSPCPSEVKCGCYYEGEQRILWLCSSDGVNSQVESLELHPTYLTQRGSFHLAESRVLAMEPLGTPAALAYGTDSHRLVVVDGGTWAELDSVTLPGPVIQVCFHCDQLAAGLSCGVLALFHPSADTGWKLGEAVLVTLDSNYPVSCVLPMGPALYCGCGPRIWVVEPRTGHAAKSYPVGDDGSAEVTHLAHSGSGLWVALRECPSIFLFHTESFQLLQDINVASHISGAPELVWVSSLTATRGEGLLWVGTSCGAVVTIPLPRLEGVPIVGRRGQHMSVHRHLGPVTLLLPLHPPDHCPSHPTLPRPVHKQRSDPMLPQPMPRSRGTSLSPYKGGELHESGAKTLPRGMTFYPPLTPPAADVYGLYADLMNVHDYEAEEDERVYERLNHSDPELHGKGTLSRGPGGRPRSWDLSATEDSDSTAASEPCSAPATVSPSSPSSGPPRTALMVSGGSGYIHQGKSSPSAPVATVILWETKAL